MRAYNLLEKQFARISSIEHASAILGWDEAVMMPAGGGDARARALAELKVLKHEILHSDHLYELVLESESSELLKLNAWQRANLREMKVLITNARAVKKDLIEALSLANSRCEQAWRSLRADNNWTEFLPLLEKVIVLCREEANQRSAASGMEPYDCLLDQFNPGLNSTDVTAIFDQVKNFLPNLIQQVVEKQKSLNFTKPDSLIPSERQKNLGQEVMKILGFDFNHGRLDVSHHPFCGGVPQDIRITTRYNTSNFLESLMGVIHEAGHACYEQNLPREWMSQPVGLPRGMHIHESQSLFFELFIGRSRSFISYLQPQIIQSLMPQSQDPAWTPENLYWLFNRVEPSLIRVNADEVTYPSHVILRYEIEQDLIAGKIRAQDIPEVWDQKMLEYLGLSTAGNFKDGCMQDVHWASGAFGYFPSYSLGALTAAQLFYTIKQVVHNLEEALEQGNLTQVHQWLRGHIWSQGCLLSSKDLIQKATGEPLNPAYFEKHIEEKFLSNH